MSSARKRKQPVIMIADHDEEERGLLRAILKLIGFQVVEAWDGHQAIRLAQRESPDLLVVDLTLPRLGGREGLDKIRRLSDRPTLPIVAVSPDRVDYQSSGSKTVFLLKPIEYEQLYALLARFLPRHNTITTRLKCLPL